MRCLQKRRFQQSLEGGGREGKPHFSGTSTHKTTARKQFYVPAGSPPTTAIVQGSGSQQEMDNTPESSSFCQLLILQPPHPLLVFLMSPNLSFLINR